MIDAYALITQALSAFNEERNDLALKIIKQAQSDFPTNILVHQTAQTIYSGLNLLDDSEKAYQLSCQLDPTKPKPENFRVVNTAIGELKLEVLKLKVSKSLSFDVKFTNETQNNIVVVHSLGTKNNNSESFFNVTRSPHCVQVWVEEPNLYIGKVYRSYEENHFWSQLRAGSSRTLRVAATEKELSVLSLHNFNCVNLMFTCQYMVCGNEIDSYFNDNESIDSLPGAAGGKSWRVLKVALPFSSHLKFAESAKVFFQLK